MKNLKNIDRSTLDTIFADPAFDYSRLFEVVDDEGNTPAHLMFVNDPAGMQAYVVLNLLAQMQQANLLQQFINTKNTSGRTPLQIFLTSWIQEQPIQLQKLEEIDDMWPGCIVTAMTECMDDMNLLHYLMGAGNNLKWDRQTGNPLFSLLVDMARCPISLQRNNLRLPSTHAIHGTPLHVNPARLRESDYDTAGGFQQQAAILSGANNASRSRYETIYDTNPNVKKELRQFLIGQHQRADSTLTPIMRNSLNAFFNQATFNTIFMTQDMQGLNVVELAIRSSLACAANEIDDYQITATSHLAASGTDNYHLLSWIIANSQIERDCDADHLPFTLALWHLLVEQQMRDIALLLLDIEPSLFFKVLDIVQQMSSPENNYFLEMHQRFQEKYGVALPDMIKRKELKSIEAFTVQQQLDIGCTLANDDNDAVDNADDNENENVFSKLIATYIVKSKNHDHPDYIRDLDACQRDIAEQRELDIAVKASRDEGDITPLFSDYFDQAELALHHQMREGLTQHELTYIPRYLPIITNVYRGPLKGTVDSELNLIKNNYFESIFTADVSLFFLALIHEDCAISQPAVYHEWLASKGLARRIDAGEYTDIILRAIVMNAMLLQSTDAVIKLIEKIGSHNKPETANTDDDGSDDNSANDESALAQTKQAKLKFTTALLDVWLSVADSLYPKSHMQQSATQLRNKAKLHGADRVQDFLDKATGALVKATKLVVKDTQAYPAKRAGMLERFLKPKSKSNPWDAAFARAATRAKAKKEEISEPNDDTDNTPVVKATKQKSALGQLRNVTAIPDALFKAYPGLLKIAHDFRHPHARTQSLAERPVPFLSAWACLEYRIPLLAPRSAAIADVTKDLNVAVMSMNLWMLPSRFGTKATEEKLDFLIPGEMEASDRLNVLATVMERLLAADLNEVGLRTVDVLAKMIMSIANEQDYQQAQLAEFAQKINDRSDVFKQHQLTHAFVFAQKVKDLTPTPLVDLLKAILNPPGQSEPNQVAVGCIIHLVVLIENNKKKPLAHADLKSWIDRVIATLDLNATQIPFWKNLSIVYNRFKHGNEAFFNLLENIVKDPKQPEFEVVRQRMRALNATSPSAFNSLSDVELAASIEAVAGHIKNETRQVAEWIKSLYLYRGSISVCAQLLKKYNKESCKPAYGIIGMTETVFLAQADMKPVEVLLSKLFSPTGDLHEHAKKCLDEENITEKMGAQEALTRLTNHIHGGSPKGSLKHVQTQQFYTVLYNILLLPDVAAAANSIDDDNEAGNAAPAANPILAICLQAQVFYRLNNPDHNIIPFNCFMDALVDAAKEDPAALKASVIAFISTEPKKSGADRDNHRAMCQQLLALRNAVDATKSYATLAGADMVKSATPAQVATVAQIALKMSLVEQGFAASSSLGGKFKRTFTRDTAQRKALDNIVKEARGFIGGNEFERRRQLLLQPINGYLAEALQGKHHVLPHDAATMSAELATTGSSAMLDHFVAKIFDNHYPHKQYIQQQERDQLQTANDHVVTLDNDGITDNKM